MKFVFDKKFIFDMYPQLLAHHKKSIDLIERSYELSELLEKGECLRENVMEANQEVLDYNRNVYAKAIHDEFFNKQILLRDRKTKKKAKFDDVFPSPFEQLTEIQRSSLYGVIESNWGWFLPAEFYQ